MVLVVGSCIDELGYMELDKHGAELLFQVLTEREEKNSVAIASNEAFGGWTKTFTDPRLCTAIVDRLTFNGTIIETDTDSYRLAQSRAKAEQAAATRAEPETHAPRTVLSAPSPALLNLCIGTQSAITAHVPATRRPADTG